MFYKALQTDTLFAMFLKIQADYMDIVKLLKFKFFFKQSIRDFCYKRVIILFYYFLLAKLLRSFSFISLHINFLTKEKVINYQNLVLYLIKEF